LREKRKALFTEHQSRTTNFMTLLPIFLNLESRTGLLVGAGAVALDKVGTLLPTGVRLRVVAPVARPEFVELAAQGKIELVTRTFEPDDLDGQFIVIAATDAPAVNAEVYRLARERGILTNSVDDIPNCDFFFGSVVRRGALQVAISTAGESPAFAQRLRREIDAQLPAEIGPWLNDLGRLRRQILSTLPAVDSRKALLHRLANRPVAGTRSKLLADDGDALDGCSSGAKAPSHFADLVGPAEAVPLLQSKSDPRVYLVGAGPGSPDLLTVKAYQLIQTADVILHDDLVAPAILELASPHAVVVNVGKRCGVKTITQDEINALMVEHARLGGSVVRLKSGDPLLFGRAAEEIAALTEAGVAHEIVPGVSAAFAAAAAIGCSLTDREWASNVIFSAGQHAQSHNKAALPAIEDATRVVYMPGRDLTLLAAQWLAEGLPPDLPCAIVSRAAQPDQSVFHTTLGELPAARVAQAPSLLLAGWAVRERVAQHLPAAVATA
jgi:uroporphyrin-III C-methyltransferase / precorrin-2 dehydrogenase / sirohydrochlorin ferrochelatase